MFVVFMCFYFLATYKWGTPGEWGPCSKPCDAGLRHRETPCVWREGGDMEMLLNFCVLEDRPTFEEACNTDVTCNGKIFI